MFKNLIIQFLLRMLPDWNNPEAVRQFVIKILGYLDDLAESTSTQIDDAIVDGLQKFTANQEMWILFYGLVLDLFNGEESVSPGNARVVALADEAKIDPAVIILIINAVMELIKWWRDRRTAEEVVTENLD